MASRRLHSVDVLRGTAIVLMVGYHFCYDLTYFRFARFDFYNDPFWLSFRTLILSLFLGLVGVSLWLAQGRGLNWPKAWRRAGLIAANAALISLVTWQLFGERYIYFGVLHFIVVASLLGLLFLRLYWTNLLAGGAVLLLGQYQNAWFDQPSRQWLGMMTHKPATEDYVPLVPWFGVVLIGLFVAQAVYSKTALPVSAGWLGHRALRPVRWMGRHSLLIYMLHQPVLMGGLRLVAG